MRAFADASRPIDAVSPMIYGQFIEHFYRQIYGGIYEPGSPLADEDGFRTDVLKALRALKVPVVRWPGGCFASAYHWKKGVGPVRTPYFDKAWRVEEPNTFGTDEFIRFCRKIGAEPYICANAGTGTAEEMSDWVEYCNEPHLGEWAKKRAAYGNPEPFRVKYWSIGNENYTSGEIGSKTVAAWGPFVREAAKMMLRVDPTIELFAASVPDLDWNLGLLRSAGDLIHWLSIHEYWDPAWEENKLSDYTGAMRASTRVENSIKKTEAILCALGYEKRIRIAFDEWNLRGWHHPGVMDFSRLIPDHAACEAHREKNEDDAVYTMADAVFSACFLNACIRHAGSVGMANFSPIANTRGAIHVHPDGLVLRPTYHVFKLFADHMGSTAVDGYISSGETFDAGDEKVAALDMAATVDERGTLRVALVNRHPDAALDLDFNPRGAAFEGCATLHTVNGPDKDSFNSIDCPDAVTTRCKALTPEGGSLALVLEPHSVNVLVWEKEKA